MNDQANALRGLMQRESAQRSSQQRRFSDDDDSGRRAWTIAVTSGKGGVGKTNVALSLAIALANQDRRVCVLDANLGLGNVDLLCGLNGYWNLSHVITGARRLHEIVLEGPAGISVIPGASGLYDQTQLMSSLSRDLLLQLEEQEREFDFVLIDTGCGVHPGVRQLVTAADTVLVMTTPEPTSVADAYATIKSISAIPSIQQRLELLVNMAESEAQAELVVDRLRQTSRLFVQTELATAGYIPFDIAVRTAVFARQPFQTFDPDCRAAQAIESLARRYANAIHGRAAVSETFFTRLFQSSGSAA